MWDELRDVKNVVSLVSGRQSKSVSHRAYTFRDREGTTVFRIEFGAVIESREVFTAEPDLFTDLVLDVAAAWVRVIFLAPLRLPDVVLRPIAELTENLCHRRSECRGQSPDDVQVSSSEGVLPYHNLEGRQLGR